MRRVLLVCTAACPAARSARSRRWPGQASRGRAGRRRPPWESGAVRGLAARRPACRCELAETPEEVMAAAVEHRADAVLSLCAKGHRLGGPAAARLGLPAVWWRMLTPRGRPYEAAAAEVPAAAVASPDRAAAAVQRRLGPGMPVEAIPARDRRRRGAAWRGTGRALRERLARARWSGIVGRIDPAKGQDDFLRAAALLDAVAPVRRRRRGDRRPRGRPAGAAARARLRAGDRRPRDVHRPRRGPAALVRRARHHRRRLPPRGVRARVRRGARARRPGRGDRDRRPVGDPAGRRVRPAARSGRRSPTACARALREPAAGRP